MLTRIITAVVALAVFVAVLMAPPIVFALALGAVVLVMLWECYTTTKADTATRVVGVISALLIMSSFYIVSAWTNNGEPTDLWLLMIGALSIIMILYMILIVAKHGKKDYKEILSSAFLTLYVVVSMSAIWWIKEEMDIVTMLLIFICAWSTDTFAYFTGCLCGKHKLIPHVSPKKTIEGAVGGVIGSTVVCSIYMGVFHNPIIVGLVFGFIGSIISQLGDLTASAIKRDAGIKDFGWIFPGHGGFMDRFDSVMLVSLCMFVMFYVLQVIEIL